jgi:hypothetical protein
LERGAFWRGGLLKRGFNEEEGIMGRGLIGKEC